MDDKTHLVEATVHFSLTSSHRGQHTYFYPHVSPRAVWLVGCSDADIFTYSLSNDILPVVSTYSCGRASIPKTSKKTPIVFFYIPYSLMLFFCVE